MQQLIKTQREYFLTGSTLSLVKRKDALKKLLALLQENERELLDAIYMDFKKSHEDSFATELAPLYHDIRFAIRNLNRWAKKKSVKTNLLNMPGKSYIIPEPYGVVLVIGAWNYPYYLSLGPTIAALAAGNCVVLKPSELTQNSSKLLHKLIASSFDPAYFSIVEGGVSETTALLDERFDKIFFTGSVPVGKIIYKKAAEKMTPITLELGGKSPVIIMEDAHLEIAARRIVWGKFLNAGQICIAPDYLLVHQSIIDKFKELLKLEIERSSFHLNHHNYVQIVNQKNFNRLVAMIDPSHIYFGGEIDSVNRTISPTLLKDIKKDDPIMQQEIFGPILPIIAIESMDDAINYVRTGEKPLSAYLFTDNVLYKNRFLTELSFGGGAINDVIMQISNPYLPFGGIGESGIGSYHGDEGFKTFSHSKSILEKGWNFEPLLKYSPYTPIKRYLLKLILKFT